MKRYGKNSAMHNRRNLVTVYLDDKEAELLQKISKQTDMSNDAILRQSFRMYQMIRYKNCSTFRRFEGPNSFPIFDLRERTT